MNILTIIITRLVIASDVSSTQVEFVECMNILVTVITTLVIACDVSSTLGLYFCLCGQLDHNYEYSHFSPR